MSSDSEEENRAKHEQGNSNWSMYNRRSRSQSRSRSRSLSRSRSQSAERSHHSDDHKDFQRKASARQHSPDERENGMMGELDGMKAERRSKSPVNTESERRSHMVKRISRSRSKSKPRDHDMAKDHKSSSSSKKKLRTRKSRSKSRRRSRSRTKRSRSRSRKRSRSMSRSSCSRSRRRSRSRSKRRSRSRSRRRSRSRSRSRSGTPIDGARLHVAELDVDTRKRDLERVFEKYGRLREIWMARNPPCFAFVVYAHQKDADRALKETDGIMIGHCRIKVTQARPRVRGGRMRGGYDPNLRCYQCGELGHFSRNCTDTKFGYKRPPTPPGNVIWRGPQL